MKSTSKALAIVIALFFTAIGVGSVPVSAATSPLSGHNPASFDTLPSRSATIHEDPYQATDLETYTYTDGTGSYRFEDLPHGTHKVTLDPATLPPSLRPAVGESVPILWLTPGLEQTSEPLSTSVRFTASYDRDSGVIAGLVFLDRDGDGWPDPGEPGLPGVRVIDPTVHQYYVPFNDANLWTLFNNKDTGLPVVQQCHPTGTPVAGTLNSSIFLIASSDGTAFYYDHWEDGYDTNPLVPGATTEVGILDAGAFRVFQDNIDPAQVGTPGVLFYDGRDRITVVGEEASVVRQVYPSTPGTLLAAAWEVSEVADWGTHFIATVGEDLAFSPGAVQDHDFAGLEVMAALPGTQVYFSNDNGTVVQTLGAGGTLFIDGANNGNGNGGVDSTDTITATGPIQVQMLTGGCGDPYSANGYTLQPVNVWDNTYWAPVPGFAPECGTSIYTADTDIYLHNPDPTGAIVVTVSSDVGTVDVTIPPASTISVLRATGWADVSTENHGVHLSSSDIFWGVSVIDSSTNETSQSQNFDWGYSLISQSELSSQVVIGYAPGNGDLAPLDNGNLAFVTAITDTVIYVDLNQDDLPDPVDMNGNGNRNDPNVWGIDGWDEPLSALGIPLEAGHVLRVGDPNDRNLMGALIYTLNLDEKIAVAWGQDPCRADYARPYLDLGYTALPVSVPRLSKADDLAVDADLSGGVSPGDTITYTLVLKNNGTGSMSNVSLTDNMPYTYTTFVVGSLQATTPPPVRTVEYYNGTSWVTSPIANAQMLRVWWDALGPGQTITVTFRVQLQARMPVTVNEISNRAVVESSETDPRLSEDPDDPPDPDTDTPVQRPLLSIDKRVSPTIVQPGDLITYTLVVSNYGNGVALLTAITDVLPWGVTYVSDTLNLTWPVARPGEPTTRAVTETTYFHGYYADNFDDPTATQATNYTGNDGSLTWSTNWAEVNDNGDPASGEVRVQEDVANALTGSRPAYLWMIDNNDIEACAQRTASLSEFRAPMLRYYVQGAAGAGANYRVGVNGAYPITEQYTGTWTIRETPLTPGGPVAVSFCATGAMGAPDYYRFDNVSIHETDPQRVATRVLTYETTTLAYFNSTGGNPVSYDRPSGHMVITEGVRLPAGSVTTATFITATFQARVTAPLTDGLTLGNTACTTATNWLEILSPPCDTASVQVQSSHALTITKTAFPSPVRIGGLLTYTLHYTITGDEAVESMVVSDTTPVNTTFYAATPAPTSAPAVGTRGPVRWRVAAGLWPPGGPVTIPQTGMLTMVVRVDSALISGTLIYNAVTISDTTGLTDTHEITTPVILAPGLELIKTVEPEHAAHDMPFTYRLRIVNTGNYTFTTLRLTDNLPTADFHYIRGSGIPADPDTIAEPLLVWSDLVPITGELDPGESLTVTFQVTTALASNDAYTNTASVVGGYLGGTLTDTDESVVFIADPAVAVDKEVAWVDPAEHVAPNYVTFTISIANTGPSTITVLPLLDRYEPYFLTLDLTNKYPQYPKPHVEPYPDQITETLGLLYWGDLTAAPHGFGRDLPPGEAFVITTVFLITGTGTTTNIATVTGAVDIYGNPANEDRDEATIGVDTPVKLLYFRATAEESAIRLEWATAGEVGIAGFRVYRALDRNFGHAQAIADIPATGPGSTYSYLDREVTPGQVYWYWLAEVSPYGNETYYGPAWSGIGPHALPYHFYLPLIQKGWGERTVGTLTK